MKLILGLGNPGAEYEKTRHNVGFMAVDALAESLDAAWKKDVKRKAQVAKADLDGTPVILAKPATFMNLSGDAAAALVSFYKAPLKDVLMVHDDMDLPPGRMKFTAEGGAAGHNGVADIQTKLGTDKIARLRLGIGRPGDQSPPRSGVPLRGTMPSSDFVLGHLSPEDSPNALDTVSAMRDWIEGGLKKAANKWNRRGNDKTTG